MFKYIHNIVDEDSVTKLSPEKANYAENFDLENIVTPIKVDALVKALEEAQYDKKEIAYLENGFRYGFNIGYQGSKIRKSTAKNIPLHVGSKTELWNKLIKEVEAKRVAGPFDSIPYENYIKSPIGLVPKAGSTDHT